MSPRVPTRHSTVVVPCPGWRDDATECMAPLEIDIEIIGRHRRASYWQPAEAPEVYPNAIPTRCDVCGTEFDRSDRDEIRRAAERAGEEVAYAA